MWVPRTPKRADFCGCPPCPICYCWADGEKITDGVSKMIDNLIETMGGVQPTTDQRADLVKVADKIHVSNLARTKETEDRIAAAKVAEEERWAGIRTEAFLKEKLREQAREKPKVDLRPTLDELPAEAFAEKPKEEIYTFTGVFTASRLFNSRIAEIYRDSLASRGPVLWGVDPAAEELKPAKAAPDAKWGGGDVKKKAEKQARRAREAALRR